MKKSLLVLSICAVFAVALVAAVATADTPSDEVRIAKLVTEMTNTSSAQLAALEPLKVRRFELPPPGVDVMRARIDETYFVEGIGEDTVELSGWVAVKHFNTRAVNTNDLSWDNAVTSTEFVGMHLAGTSELFGPVEVTLHGSQEVGEVGRIQLPEYVEVALRAKLEQDATLIAANVAPVEEAVATEGACVADVSVAVKMPNLGIDMHTATPVYWYSLVDTIPPVGHTASIAVEPVALVSEGREIGTLKSGTVKFREVVRHLPLVDAPSYGDDQIAANN
jgi:hypothetical protein